MLTDQIFARPIDVIIGPEVFYQDNPMKMNMPVVQLFQKEIVPSGMFHFFYLAFAESRRFGKQQGYAEALRDYGIPFMLLLIERPVRRSVGDMIRTLAQNVEMGFPGESLKRLSARLLHQYNGTNEQFANALYLQTKTTASWSWETFVSL